MIDLPEVQKGKKKCLACHHVGCVCVQFKCLSTSSKHEFVYTTTTCDLQVTDLFKHLALKFYGDTL